MDGKMDGSDGSISPRLKQAQTYGTHCRHCCSLMAVKKLS